MMTASVGPAGAGSPSVQGKGEARLCILHRAVPFVDAFVVGIRIVGFQPRDRNVIADVECVFVYCWLPVP